MNQGFQDGVRSKRRDPVDARDPDFDWQRLYERLNEEANPEGNDPQRAQIVRHLLQVLVPHHEGPVYLRSLGLRLIALAWVLDPTYFPGSPSLRELARRAHVTPAKLARHTGRFSRLFRWRHRGQRHAWNWHQGQRSREE